MDEINYILQTTRKDINGKTSKTIVWDRNGPLGLTRDRMKKKKDLKEAGNEDVELDSPAAVGYTAQWQALVNTVRTLNVQQTGNFLTNLLEWLLYIEVFKNFAPRS